MAAARQAAVKFLLGMSASLVPVSQIARITDTRGKSRICAKEEMGRKQGLGARRFRVM